MKPELNKQNVLSYGESRDADEAEIKFRESVEIVDNVLRLQHELTAARENARGKLLTAANEALAQLRILGYYFELVESGRKRIGRPRKDQATKFSEPAEQLDGGHHD